MTGTPRRGHPISRSYPVLALMLVSGVAIFIGGGPGNGVSTAAETDRHAHSHEPQHPTPSADSATAALAPTAAEDRSTESWWERLWRAIRMRDYNTRVVLLGTTLLGIGAGVVGTFMLLRKRSLVGDVVGHAALPGVALAFLIAEISSPGSGRWLPGLLFGAAVAGLAGGVCVSLVKRYSKIKQDAALAIVLSIFFGLGAALFTTVQKMPSGNAAGLEDFILGQAAAVNARDVSIIGGVSLAVTLTCGLLLKEFTLLSFDSRFAASRGWPVGLLDLALMGLVVAVAVVGMQSVGLVLVVALLITPAAAARFWTDHLPTMTVTAAGLGGLGAYLGTLASTVVPRLAAGATIILVGSALFAVSMVLGARRGVVWRLWWRHRLRRSIGREHLLRAVYEFIESHSDGEPEIAKTPVPLAALPEMRSWSQRRLGTLVDRAIRAGLLQRQNGSLRLTSAGAAEARRLVRNHRLWELYLIHYADVAPSHVDRDADHIEHVLGPEIVAELERLLEAQDPQTAVPPSPHELPAPTTAAVR